MRNVLFALGSYASLAGLYYTVRPSGLAYTLAEELLLISSVILALVHLGYEIVFITKNRPKRLDNDREVTAYMQSWVSGNGRTSVLAGDMSWVHDTAIKHLLEDMAKNSNLTLFMSRETELSRHLQTQGAEVFYYGRYHLAPTTRFAITNEGRADARAVLGTRDSKGRLEVNEYVPGQPAFHLCSDVVTALRRRLAF